MYIHKCNQLHFINTVRNSGMWYANFSYHDIGAFFIAIQYISRYTPGGRNDYEALLAMKLMIKAANLVFSDNTITCRALLTYHHTIIY